MCIFNWEKTDTCIKFSTELMWFKSFLTLVYVTLEVLIVCLVVMMLDAKVTVI